MILPITPHMHARAGGYVIRAGVHICDWLWEKGHIPAYFQNRVIGTAG